MKKKEKSTSDSLMEDIKKLSDYVSNIGVNQILTEKLLINCLKQPILARKIEKH